MNSGTVHNWFENPNRGKGYGFIIPAEGGADVFVHRQHFTNAFQLQTDGTVSYDMATNPRTQKDHAINVKVLSKQLTTSYTTRTPAGSNWWRGYESQWTDDHVPPRRKQKQKTRPPIRSRWPQPSY